MNVKNLIQEFIACPFPMWESDLTSALVAERMYLLSKMGIISSAKHYNTSSALLKRPYENTVHLPLSGDQCCLEYPSFDSLGAFYNEHGLRPMDIPELHDAMAVTKVAAALDILGYVPECLHCVTTLATRIQVLKQEQADYDTSYSHPDIPFSIFVSVCEDDSVLSSLRVAESILHESMHLKLTLIERHLPLVEASSNVTHYSPWRDEQRPLRGVLHGIFVFSSILNFYRKLKPHFCKIPMTIDFMDYRVESIVNELNLVQDIRFNAAFTKDGQILATKLLQQNFLSKNQLP